MYGSKQIMNNVNNKYGVVLIPRIGLVSRI